MRGSLVKSSRSLDSEPSSATATKSQKGKFRISEEMGSLTMETQLQPSAIPTAHLKTAPRTRDTAAMSSTTSLSPASTPAPRDPIPLFYRLTLLYIEPFFAITGSLLLHFHPSTFLTTMTPSSPPSPAALSSVRVLTDQLAAMQLLLAFNLGVVLRFAVPSSAAAGYRPAVVRVWRICCAGMLMCDALHVAASVRELGWGVVLAPGDRWRAEEWVNFGILAWMALVRLGVVLGVGMCAGEGTEADVKVMPNEEKKNLLS